MYKMKTGKKLIAVFTALLALVLCFTGCGGSSGGGSSGGGTTGGNTETGNIGGTAGASSSNNAATGNTNNAGTSSTSGSTDENVLVGTWEIDWDKCGVRLEDDPIGSDIRRLSANSANSTITFWSDGTCGGELLTNLFFGGYDSDYWHYSGFSLVSWRYLQTEQQYKFEISAYETSRDQPFVTTIRFDNEYIIIPAQTLEATNSPHAFAGDGTAMDQYYHCFDMYYRRVA